MEYIEPLHLVPRSQLVKIWKNDISHKIRNYYISHKIRLPSNFKYLNFIRMAQKTYIALKKKRFCKLTLSETLTNLEILFENYLFM